MVGPLSSANATQTVNVRMTTPPAAWRTNIRRGMRIPCKIEANPAVLYRFVVAGLWRDRGATWNGATATRKPPPPLRRAFAKI
jgi:hypothetical protein